MLTFVTQVVLAHQHISTSAHSTTNTTNTTVKYITLFLLFIVFSMPLRGGEGMWLPLLLSQLNEAEMQSMGMKMTAEDIYSINKGSLKDAIVHFGGFCTSELISPDGLLLTNHHCGYSEIQAHSTLENNYLENGFWAMNRSQELANSGLSAIFIARIEDVTDAVLKGVADNMGQQAREDLIAENITKAENSANLKKHEKARIKPFFHGNQYFMIVTVTYPDVRLVGAPPSAIGKFGADTDNWEWPRHTGDFALFRIYADKNNMPAEYSKDNVPYTPKHYLPISLDGVAEDDFTLVFGFPGRTQQYLPGVAVKQLIDVVNPARIAIRDKALKIVDAEMRADKQTQIQYASKFASIANYWKKWIGENQGLKSTNALSKKNNQEIVFKKRVKRNTKWKHAYGHILPAFEDLYTQIEPYALTRNYYNEIFSRNVEIFRNASLLNRLINRYESGGEEAYNAFKARLLPYLEGQYKNYRHDIDQKVLGALLEMFVNGVPLADVAQPIENFMQNDQVEGYEGMAALLFRKSKIKDFNALKAMLDQSPASAIQAIKADPIYQFGQQMRTAYETHSAAKYDDLQTQIDELQRLYMKGLMEVFPKRKFYPDANSTMRVTYGKVQGYTPRDGIQYIPKTYLQGVIEKYKPGDYEFDVPEKLLQLYRSKDYGPYAENGKIPVCFLGSNHTTGGNSGSPAIDAHGNLVGLNFDRVWEGTMSDINYDVSICRNIMVDVRYILFIIDKYAGAKHLIDEMQLVHPKKEMTEEVEESHIKVLKDKRSHKKPQRRTENR